MKVAVYLPAILFFIISTVLLVMPGDQLPKSSFFDIPFFDKYVHFGMFALLTLSFSLPVIRSEIERANKLSLVFSIALYVIVYGIVMEFVQKYFVPFRSFDMTDVLFDAIGAFTGYGVVRKMSYKKIGPNGNRGRNQN